MTGGGAFALACERRLRELTGTDHAFLAPSATAAFELAALTLDLQPGDEVVLASFTFPSTANAVALRGAAPVFCYVRPDTLNVGAEEVAACLSPRTRAVIVVHYAGNPAEMRPLQALCQRHGLSLVEDAAQALGSSLDGIPAGRWSDIGALKLPRHQESRLWRRRRAADRPAGTGRPRGAGARGAVGCPLPLRRRRSGKRIVTATHSLLRVQERSTAGLLHVGVNLRWLAACTAVSRRLPGQHWRRWFPIHPTFTTEDRP